MTPLPKRFPPPSGVRALFFLYKNPRQSRPEALLEGSKNFRESAFSGTFSSPHTFCTPPYHGPKIVRKIPAHINKIGISPPKHKIPPPPKRGIVWTLVFLQKERIFPGAHKIGAAISGPRIADMNFTDTRIFLKSTPTPDTSEKYRDMPPISIVILLQKYALFLAESSIYATNLYHDTAPILAAGTKDTSWCGCPQWYVVHLSAPSPGDDLRSKSAIHLRDQTSRAAKQGGFKTGGVPDLDLSLLFLSLLGLSRFFRDFPDLLGDGPGIFPIRTFSLSRPIIEHLRGSVPKGSATQSGPLLKKVGNPPFGNPPV